MKKVLTGLLLATLFIGCTKTSDIQSTNNPPQQLILKNPNISVVNVSAVQTGNKQVTFSFSTEYEKDLASIELLSGADETLFCQIYVEFKDDHSLQLKQYKIVDNDPKGPETNYMIKYTTKTGSWFCSSIYKVKIK